MDAKKILKRILMTPLNLINKKVKKTNWYCNSIPNLANYPGDAWYREHLDRNYDIVNLGSSSAVFCFDYDGFGIKAFNWALKPQSMEYSFKILKQYFSILKKNGIVLIPFFPFSGLSVIGKWKENVNDKYFHILDRTLIDDYESVAQRRKNPFFSMPLLSIKRLIKDVPRGDMYSYNVHCKTAEEFDKNAKHWIDLWMKQFNISDLEVSLSEENLKGRKERITTIRNIITFCIERELIPVIVIPPVHPSLNTYFSPIFCDIYINSFIKELGIDGVKVINHLGDAKFIKNEFFRDSFFMSKVGAKEYTKEILTEINLINI